MQDLNKFVKLLFSGWEENIQHEIRANMFYPIKRIYWMIDVVLGRKDIRLIHKILSNTQGVLSFYEQLCLKSFYAKTSAEDEIKATEETKPLDVEKMVNEMGEVEEIPKTSEEKEEKPISRFHESMGIVKNRIDSLINDVKVKGVDKEEKMLGFISEINNFMDFIFQSMNVTKEISQQKGKELTGIDDIRDSVEQNIVPLMVRRHIEREIPITRRLGRKPQPVITQESNNLEGGIRIGS